MSNWAALAWSGKPAAPECLVDGTYIRLLHRDGPATPALVIFGDEVSGPRGTAARALRVGAHPEADLYEILPNGPNWFPVTETGPMVETLARDKMDKPAVALGASMGGYGALRYGARAGCTTALAFSPQARLDPAMAGPGARHSGHFRADLHHDMEVSPAHLPERAYVIVDPEDAHDLLHAELLRHEAGVDVIPLKRMGHRTEQALSSPKITEEVLRAAAAGDREDLARALRRGQRAVPRYLARLSMACSERGHARWGAEIAQLPEREGKPLAPDLRMALARARAELGEPMAALELIETLIVDTPTNPRFWRALSEQYEAMGEAHAACDVLELALEETENFQLCWKLIQIRFSLGSLEEAGLLAEMAGELWPERFGQIERMKTRIAKAA
ncbi:hypothetical protein R3X27_11850 [Tropicimonas sp. TH_r6]|uniref:tetratricopeptide repeat protein n=1 Tax=Tropicimonas sp. TH_r6 TaxID=3082085 RepID=UPI002955070D|nr:hypothetical protein [Tropicimonas sp. TH_r6]MDV7143376.1 hypothetical protein [Tropicimonas sp. TH_r6]